MSGGQDSKWWDNYDSPEQMNFLREVNNLERTLSREFTAKNAKALLEKIQNYYERYPLEKREETGLKKHFFI